MVQQSNQDDSRAIFKRPMKPANELYSIAVRRKIKHQRWMRESKEIDGDQMLARDIE
jgi:hypothetical protein